jgi:hypothetical protein
MEPMDLSKIDNITFAIQLTTLFNTWHILAWSYTQVEIYPELLISASATPMFFVPFTIVICN